jgi:hypothetical protein
MSNNPLSLHGQLQDSFTNVIPYSSGIQPFLFAYPQI